MPVRKIRFLRYGVSEGCHDLCNSLKEDGYDAKKLKVEGSTYCGYPGHLVVNWGSSSRKSIREGIPILNEPSAVRLASEKFNTFQVLDRDGLGRYTPKYTDVKSVAVDWIERDCDMVYCRELTRGSQGRGIVIARQVEELVDAPLYTAGLSVDREVRIHVFKGNVIDFSQKKRMGRDRREEVGIESNVNEEIRNHANGWVFAREGVSIPDDAKDVAIRAIGILGLDFGAVDMIITLQRMPKILEVNTAPGLEGTTLDSYKEALLRVINE